MSGYRITGKAKTLLHKCNACAFFECTITARWYNKELMST